MLQSQACTLKITRNNKNAKLILINVQVVYTIKETSERNRTPQTSASDVLNPLIFLNARVVKQYYCLYHDDEVQVELPEQQVLAPGVRTTKF